MIGKVVFVVDGSVPSCEAATKAHGLLPQATEVLVLQVVPQLPYAWTAWPSFPDSGEDLARASAYVTEVASELKARGWNVSTKVYFSPLGAAEMDREVLKLTTTLRPDLICLALARGSVRASIVREAAVPVLVAVPSPTAEDVTGSRDRCRTYPEHVLAHPALLQNPASALVFRQAGLL